MNDRHLKLKDAIEVVRETVADEYIESTLELRLLDKSLTADVRENVRGEWIVKKDIINCSVCKRCSWSKSYEDLVRSFNFCPNCGADMRHQS